MTNNTFLGYEQDDKFLFVRPANIITIYQWGAEYILETDKKQHVVKDEESACLIGFTKPLVKINGEYQGAERTVPINTDKILSLELHHNDYTIELPNDNVITPKTTLELNESVNMFFCEISPARAARAITPYDNACGRPAPGGGITGIGDSRRHCRVMVLQWRV